MAIKERSIGPLYLAKIPVIVKRCPVHKAQVVEMTTPWRRGTTIVLPWRPFKAVAIGLWTRSLEKDIAEDFENDRWFEPKWLNGVKPDDISHWGHDETKKTEEN